LINKKKILALIPARGGSKRLPRKNILDLAGKPMLAWSILAGLESQYIDDVVVSTDDKSIADMALLYGAKVPFIRPDELSGDDATSVDVVVHALEYLKQKCQLYDYVVLLQPTSPLRDAQSIDEGVLWMDQKKADCVIGMTKINHPSEWTIALPEGRCLDTFFKGMKKNSSSEYRINGALYICSVERLLEEKSLFLKSKSYAFVMGREVSVDVDDYLDFMLCEALLAARNLPLGKL